MSDTPLLALPLIEASQAQKHVTHNEALLALDGSVHLAVISRSLSAPPALPADGDRYLVAASATGEWLGHSGHIASRQGTSWRFAIPKSGWRLWVQSEELFLLFGGVAWRDLLDIDVLQNVSLLGVNTTADAASKLAVASAGLLFTHVGNDTRVKINKNAVGDTASLLFQTGFSGRAEFGLAGDDNFHVKVSPDGSAWTEAMVIDRTTGAVSLANNSIGNAALADVATATFKGRAAAGTGDPQDLTGTQATTLLDVFTPGLKGLVPASGGGTANFLRADGTFAAPAGGGGSSGGATGEVQYNNAGAFAGAADVEIETGQLRLPAIATPSAPTADGLKLFGKKRGGRMMPAQMGPSGLDTMLQPHVAATAISKWMPAGNSTTITADGAAALTATGTATAANVAATNRHTYMKRLEHLVTVAATTAVAGFRSGVAQYSVGGVGAGDGGFHMICRWGPATGVATATNRAFVGMANSVAAPTDVEPSSIINIVGMGWDAADANIQIMHRGAGAVTKIDLGASFPVPTADRTKAYELALFSKPGTTQEVGYEVTDLAIGAVASGAITTNLPTTATLLAPRGWMSVGGTSSVIGIALMGLYVESDY
jgi:Protein of unknown function (DUF2793)